MSSEALERAARIRENISHVARGCRSASSHNPAPYLNSSEAALVALLAEVARLEQERRDLKLWNTRVVEQLAVAREREQRLESVREIAEEIRDHVVARTMEVQRARMWDREPGEWTRYERLFSEAVLAALVDEPAAATTRKCPNCGGFGKVRDSMRVEPVTCGRCDGRGFIPAADEPGEGKP